MMNKINRGGFEDKDEDLSQLSILNQFEGESESWQKQTRMSLIVKIGELIQIVIPFWFGT